MWSYSFLVGWILLLGPRSVQAWPAGRDAIRQERRIKRDRQGKSNATGTQDKAGSTGKKHFDLKDGSVWACGGNAYGQLGTGGSKTGGVEAREMSAVGNTVAVAAGSNHSLILDADGNHYACESNADGQLGTGDTSIMSYVESIAAGIRHAISLKKDKTLRAVGHDYFGQLGDCTDTNRSKPVRVYY
ncbi:MAG: hypothetical protein AB1407_03820 [Spirochaetota bacterium]